MKMLYQLISKLSHHATREEFESEVHKANTEYFGITGVVYQEDRSFETRMGLFLEWYLFDRKLDSLGVTPIEYFIKNPTPDISAEEYSVLRKMPDHKHSIYEFNKVKESIVTVIDLADKKKYEVHERRGTTGFLKGDVFEARLFMYEENFLFSGPMLFHPHGAKKFIRNFLKAENGDHKQKLLALSAMSLKMERYRHVPLEKIYTQEVTQ